MTGPGSSGPPPQPFLSPAWIDAARAIRAEYAGRVPPSTTPVRVNLVVRDVPFGDGELAAHLDTSSGELDIELDHVDGAEVTVTLEYPTAKALVVDQDPQAAMQAFLSGRIKVEGDVTKILLLLQQPSGAGAAPDTGADLASRIRAITS